MVRLTQHKKEWNGEWYDSDDEIEYHKFLIGKGIDIIHRQVSIELIPKQTKMDIKHFKRKPDELYERFLENPKIYTADFVYEEDGKIVMVDVKSPYTHKFPEWSITRKMVVWLLNKRNEVFPNKKPWMFREVIATFRTRNKIKYYNFVNNDK